MTILAQSPQKSTYASTQMTVRGRIKPLGFGWLMDDPPECFSFFFPSHHVRLVNRVYPRNPSETSLARPNKLSSLMFYLTTKPSKIIKVSKYLERKVKLDITWKRFGNCKITNDILFEMLRTIANQSPASLAVFAKSTLKMLDCLLNTDHPLLIRNALPTFIKFCELHDSSPQAMDIEFLALVQSVMARIHEHANSDASNNVHRHLIRASALKAMKAAITLETFNGGGVQERLGLIWSCIINNSQEVGMLKVPMSAAKGFLVKQGSQQSLGSHNADESIELESLDGLAMQCLSTLLSRTNSASIGVVLDVLFGHFTTMTALSVSEEQCVEVFANLNGYLQHRHRFLLVTQILERFHDSEHHPKTSAVPVLKIMERLLEYPDVGRLPLIELLDVCLGLILKSETSSTGTPVMQRTQLIFRVFGFIGSSPHFASQISSGLRFLLDQLLEGGPEKQDKLNPKQLLLATTMGYLVLGSNADRFKWMNLELLEEFIALVDCSNGELRRGALFVIMRLMDWVGFIQDKNFWACVLKMLQKKLAVALKSVQLVRVEFQMIRHILISIYSMFGLAESLNWFSVLLAIYTPVDQSPNQELFHTMLCLVYWKLFKHENCLNAVEYLKSIMDESSIAAGNWDIDLDTTSNQNSRRKVVEDVISAKLITAPTGSESILTALAVRVDRQQLIDVLVNADQLQNRIPEIARILGRLESVDQQKEESVADLSRRGRSGSQSSVVDSGNITVFAVDPTQLKCESWVINRDLANIDDFKKAIFAAGAEQENGDAMDGANEDEDRRESGQPVFFQSCEYAAVDQAQFRALEELINII